MQEGVKGAPGLLISVLCGAKGSWELELLESICCGVGRADSSIQPQLWRAVGSSGKSEAGASEPGHLGFIVALKEKGVVATARD